MFIVSDPASTPASIEAHVTAANARNPAPAEAGAGLPPKGAPRLLYRDAPPEE